MPKFSILLRLAGKCVAVAGLINLPCYASEVVLGHISSLTSISSSDNATRLRAGIQLAFDAANAAGGVNGNRLKLDMRDDNLESKKMAAITDEFIADSKVIGLVGYLNSGGLADLTKADVFGKNGIALIAPYQGNAAIVQAANVFPFRSGYSDELLALLKEIKGTFKQNVVVIHQSIAFGPSMSKFAQEQAALLKIPVLGTAELDGNAGGDLAASVARAVTLVRERRPEAILLVSAGKMASEFVMAIKKSELSTTQIYGMSVIVPDAFAVTVGEKAARGIVLSQATPYPYVATSKLVAEYKRELKEFAPQQQISFGHLEGYIAGKIAIAALKKAGSKPTRESLLRALNAMGNYDLGGVSVNYSTNARRGWGGTELVIFGRDGKLIR